MSCLKYNSILVSTVDRGRYHTLQFRCKFNVVLKLPPSVR